jgi:hypothetical protein
LKLNLARQTSIYEATLTLCNFGAFGEWQSSFVDLANRERLNLTKDLRFTHPSHYYEQETQAHIKTIRFSKLCSEDHAAIVSWFPQLSPPFAGFGTEHLLRIQL